VVGVEEPFDLGAAEAEAGDSTELFFFGFDFFSLSEEVMLVVECFALAGES